MQRTAGDRRQALQRTARAPAARREAQRLQGEVDAGQIRVMPFLAYQKGNSYLSRT
ncbi:MAG: hypothetical protein ACYDHX_09450 [Methanothrix sp.]